MYREVYIVYAFSTLLKTLTLLYIGLFLIQRGAYLLSLNGRSIVTYRMRSGADEAKRVQHFLITATIPLPEKPTLPAGVELGMHISPLE